MPFFIQIGLLHDKLYQKHSALSFHLLPSVLTKWFNDFGSARVFMKTISKQAMRSKTVGTVLASLRIERLTSSDAVVRVVGLFTFLM